MVCRGNFSERVLDTPLLYDLHADPGEIYPLDTKSPEYSTILEKIKSVRCPFLLNKLVTSSFLPFLPR